MLRWFQEFVKNLVGLGIGLYLDRISRVLLGLRIGVRTRDFFIDLNWVEIVLMLSGGLGRLGVEVNGMVIFRYRLVLGLGQN